jgi:tetratricopeptide (TPR) repeat protein
MALPAGALMSASPGQGVQPDLPNKVPISIIVVETLSEAQRILEILKGGADFAELATKNSIDPSSNNAGYIGNLDPNMLRQELRDALHGVGRGELSPITRFPEGYAILKIDREAQLEIDEDNPTQNLAMTGPGAVRYGPDVSGFGEAFAIFYNNPDRPTGARLTPVSIAETDHRALAAAIKQILEQFDPAHPYEMSDQTTFHTRYLLAQLYAFQGEMGKAIEHWQQCRPSALALGPKTTRYLEGVLGTAYLHKSEMENGIYTAPGDRCLFPMSPSLRYQNTADSQKAIEHFQAYLKQAPNDLDIKWLMNLAQMTQGGYPGAIAPKDIIPLSVFESKQDIGRFIDVAPQVGIKVFSTSGGVIIDDFENRGLFDVIVSESFDQDPRDPLRYFHNNGDGTFSDQTERAGLSSGLGGLNIIQADYNNDGNMDFLVLRGAWVYPAPLSLYRGNGDGTFTDVTQQAGLDHLFATQTAAWADINNDGLLDLFVGNEKGPCHLYLNKGDGTFQDISVLAGVDRLGFIKAVVAGDYDNDGYVDFYVTNLVGDNLLYHNNGDNTFTEVGGPAGVRDPGGRSFPAFFFDYDNDGWLDIFASTYSGSVDENVRSFLGLLPNAITLKLYKNKRNGTFEDVTKEVGLDKVLMPMGSNFGDVDNDGFLDIYLGTGNAAYSSLVPNVLFRNDEGRRFVDITASSGTGDLHKGHGVAFADMSNNGQQDLLTVIGGPTPGDKHAFRFFKNPGNSNNWISVKLVGVKTCRDAHGARIKVSVENKGRAARSIYRTVGSGGSFGANPLEQHIGLGPQAMIRELEVWWPTSKTTQVFTDISTNQFIEIKEFAKQYTKRNKPQLPPGVNSTLQK